MRRSPSPLIPLLLLLFLPRLSDAQSEFRPLYVEQFRFSALDVSAEGNDLWVATLYGIELYDRSTDSPKLVASLPLPGSTVKVRAAGPLAYAASGSFIYVLAKNARGFAVVGSVDVGSTVNDLLHLPPYVYVATGTGLVQLDVLQPQHPVVSGRFATGSGGAFSLARLGSTLYVADGDSTVETYSISVPSFVQRGAGLTSLSRSTAVHTNAGRLFVSDGLHTEVFEGALPSRIAVWTGLGATSFFSSAPGIAWIAGADRRLRAIDLTDVTNPSVLFTHEVVPSGGSINRILAVTGVPGRIHAAAGDSGLLTFDTTGFDSPYVVRVLASGGVESLASTGTRVISASTSGGLQSSRIAANGVLSVARQWELTRNFLVHDSRAGRVLTSSGRTLMLWDVSSDPPLLVSQVNFPTDVRSAVSTLSGSVAGLQDGSVWTADLSQSSGVAARVSGLTGIISVARSGDSLATAELTDVGTTLVRYYSAGDITIPPATATIEGAATSGISLSGGILAAGTFKGVTLVDFRSAVTSTLLPGTAGLQIRDVAIAGPRVFVLTGTTLQVHDLATGALERTVTLPSPGLALYPADNGSTVFIATLDGIASVAYQSASLQPRLIPPVANANRYFRKLVVGGSHVYLFDGRNVDAYYLSGGVPGPLRRVSSASGIVDIAADSTRLYTLSNSGHIVAIDAGGRQAAEATIMEGTDAVALSIHAAPGAVFVSISRGCSSGACEQKTLVFDTSGGALVHTMSLPGGLLDIAVSGARAFALFDFPSEIRVLDISDPARPAVVNSRPSEGRPVSIAFSDQQSTIYTLGEKVLAYSATSLTRVGELLQPWSVASSGGLSYLDQRIRISGGIAAVGGRTFAPQLYSIAGPIDWRPLPTPATNAAVRSIHLDAGSLYLLGDYSFEVWSSMQGVEGRKRGARR